LADTIFSCHVIESFLMNVLYVLAGVIAVALTGYLCVALLKPEWFE
jgi:K+-transporting ATPase KdpF subunit